MTRRARRWAFAGLAVLAALVIPAVLLISLTYEPSFYRAKTQIPVERRRVVARQFVQQGLQLRNDIINEPRWEAVFSDEEVNAWLAEDLVEHFADQIPPGVHDPRVVFEPDRATLAFKLDQGPVRSLIWVVVRIEVREPNVVALTIEKIRAGVMPVPVEQFLNGITEHAASRGLKVDWDHTGDNPVAMIRYQPHLSRRDVVLEQLQILDGQLRLSGRSEKAIETETVLKLPTRRVLQSTFPRRNVQPPARSGISRSSLRTSST